MADAGAGPPPPLFPAAAFAAGGAAAVRAPVPAVASQAAAPDWTRLSSFVAPAALSAPPPAAAAAALHGAAGGAASADEDAGAEADAKQRRRDRKRRHAERKEAEREERKRARGDAAKIARAEAALAQSAGGGSGRTAAPPPPPPPPAPAGGAPRHWVDTSRDYEALALGGANRGAVPRFCREASLLAPLPFPLSQGGTPPSAFGARRGYAGAGLDSAPWSRDAAGATAAAEAPGRYFTAGCKRRSSSITTRLLRAPPAAARNAPPPPPLPPFVALAPLTPALGNGSGLSDIEAAGESEADAVRMRVAALNAATRERAHELAPWLELAAAHGDAAAGCRRRGEGAGWRLRQVSVLERALEHHPGSEAALLALLAAAAAAGEAPAALDARWERACRAAPGAPRLWAARLAASAATATPRERVRLAQRAAGALRTERTRRAAAGAPEESLELLSRALIDAAIAAARVELQAGAPEAALSRLQAHVEYACFGPCDEYERELSGLNAAGTAPGARMQRAARLRAFEAFWRSGAPRVGEPGAAGWGEWWAQRLSALPPPPPLPPPPLLPPGDEPPGAHADGSAPMGGDDGGKKEVDAENDGTGSAEGGTESEGTDEEEEEEDEALLARLGVTLDAGALTSALAEGTLRLWSVEERCRDTADWRPQPHAAQPEGRGLPFDAISEGLFELDGDALQLDLLTAAAALLGAPLPPRRASGDDGALDAAASCEAPPAALAALLRSAAASLPLAGGGEAAWLHGDAGRRECTAALLRAAAARHPRYVPFADALLSLAPDARAAARPLLAAARDCGALAAALAAREAAAGRTGAARKAMALALAAAPAGADVADRADTALRCARLELGTELEAAAALHRGPDADGGAARALTILSALGAGADLADTATAPGAARRAAARQGFDAMMRAIAAEGALATRPGSPAAACAAAVASAAALHAALDAGDAAAGAALLDALLAGVPPAAMARSAECESLCVLKLTLLAASCPRRPARLAAAAEAALERFPQSPAVLSAALDAAAARALPAARLRRALDAAFHKRPGAPALLAAIGAEAQAATPASALGWAASPRVRAVLARAQASPATAACPLTWRLALAAAAPGPAAARRVLLRAAAAVPGCKALWLDGLEAAAAALQPRERASLLEAMRDRGLRCRADVYQIALEEQAQALLQAAAAQEAGPNDEAEQRAERDEVVDARFE